jgi:hypothetical protein
MNTLSRIRQLAFLVIVVAALLPAAPPATAYGDDQGPCPNWNCDLSYCDFGAGYYWQDYDKMCGDTNCQCRNSGTCLYQGGAYRLCWCPECIG